MSCHCPRPNRPTPRAPRQKLEENFLAPSGYESDCGCRQYGTPGPAQGIPTCHAHAAAGRRQEFPLPGDSTTHADNAPGVHPSQNCDPDDAHLLDVIQFPFLESPYILLNYHLDPIQFDANGAGRDQSTRTSFLSLSTSFFAISAADPSSISVFFCFCGM